MLLKLTSETDDYTNALTGLVRLFEGGGGGGNSGYWVGNSLSSYVISVFTGPTFLFPTVAVPTKGQTTVNFQGTKHVM